MSEQIEKAQIPGFPEYTFTREGQVFKDGFPKVVSLKKKKSAKIIIRKNKKMYTFGFAKLIAAAFIPNPNGYKKIIFKDRNHHNCNADNILWASPTNWGIYSRAKDKFVKSTKQKKPPVSFPVLLVSGCEMKQMAGFPEYHVSSDGRIFRQGKQNKTSYNKCVKVKIKGKSVSLGKIVATHFAPNPYNYRFFIYLDRNNRNCSAQNISWVSNSKYISYAMGDKVFKPEKKPQSETKKYVRKKRPRLREQRPDIFGVHIQELVDYDLPGIFVTSDGRAFYGKRQLKLLVRRKKAPVLRFQREHQKYYFGFAKLVAAFFVRNPHHHKHIIFKDRDNRNCKPENIAWVDGETYLQYAMGSSTWRQGRKKIVFDRDDAIDKCKDDDLKGYYKTLDENWLQACWEKVEVSYSKFIWWEDIRSECYLYFIDRAKRFSIIVPVAKMLWYYAKGQRIKLQHEISPDIPYRKLVQTDESLRSEKFKNYFGRTSKEEW